MRNASDTSRSLAKILRDEAADVLPARSERIAWERLVVGAREQGLSGLVDERLEQLTTDVPNDARNIIRSERDRIAESNRVILEHLGRICSSFAEENIDVLVLKGAALILRLYDDPGLRPMTDIDLLIKPADADNADQLLHKLGYPRGKDLIRRDFYPRFHYEAEYASSARPRVRLDVHVRPWRPLRCRHTVPVDAMWDGANQEMVDGVAIPMPNNTNLLIHLLAHAAFHGADRLLWLVDIKRFIEVRCGTIDWRVLLDRVERWGLVPATRLAVQRVEEELGACVPKHVHDSLESADSSWRDRLATWQSPRDNTSPWMHVVTDLICTPGWRFRVGYLAALAVPDQGHLKELYSGRHFGWTLVAHLRRFTLNASRLVFRQSGMGPLPGNQ